MAVHGRGCPPLLQGRIATAMDGIDLSWLASTTSAAIYFILGYPRFRKRRQAGMG